MKFIIPIKPTAQMRTAVGAIKLGNGKVRAADRHRVDAIGVRGGVRLVDERDEALELGAVWSRRVAERLA